MSIAAASDPPGIPTTVVLTPGNLRATVTWDVPAADPNAGTVHHYIAQLDGTVRTCRVLAADARTCTFTGLTAGTSYTATVTAYSSTDESTGSAGVTSSAAIPGPPNPPGGGGLAAPTLVAGNQLIAVTWTAPAAGAAVATYTATAYLTSDTTVTAGTPCTVNVGTLTCNITGLTGGVSYKVKVVATGPGTTGVSAASTISAAAIPGPPSVPASIAAEPTADGTVTLTWPASTGGIANYTVITTNATTSAAVGAATCTVNALTCDINSGVVDGTSYKFQVRANGTGALGNSAYSDFSNIVTVGAPSKTGTPSATIGVNQSIVTFSAPSYVGSNSSVNHYVVSAYTGGAAVTSCTNTTTTCTVTALTAGTPYTFKVVAYGTATSAYPSPPSAASNEVTPGPPAKPGTPTAVVGNATAIVTWTHPSTGGRAVDHWIVTTKNATTDANVGGATCTVTVTGGNPLPAKSCTVNAGLVAGTPYKFTVTAYGDAGGVLGGSTASDPSVSYTTGPPTTPATPTVVAGNTTATVTWTQPAGGVAVSGYTVTVYDANNADALVADKGCTVTVLTCTVSGLAGGYYKFKVLATAANSLGTALSAASAATAIGPPLKPTITNVVADSATAATITFTPNAGTGVAIDHWEVTASPSAGTTGCLAVASGGAYTCQVTGLSANTTYSFTVKAVGATVGGVAMGSTNSDPAPGLTPGTLTAPVVGALVPGANQVLVNWTPAVGMVVEGYTVTATPVAGGGGITTGCNPAIGSATSCTVTGLAAGTAYTVTVNADELGGANRQLLSAASASVTTGPPPAAATAFATAGNGFISVTWTAPTAPDTTGTGTNGNAFLKYRAFADTTGTANDKFCESTVRTTRFCVITGVTNQLTYAVTVRTYGPGDAENWSSTSAGNAVPVGAPTVPRSVTAVAGDTVVDVNWLAPLSIGDGVVSYTVVGTGGNICVVPGGTLTCRITGLTNGQDYSFYVVANGEGIAGNSPNSTAVTATPSGAASSPTSVVATAMEHAIKVDWMAGAGGGIVTGFTVTATASGETPATCGVVAANATTCNITGLAGGKAWAVTVQANSLGGSSTAVAATPASVVPGPPNAPVITEATETAEGEITVKWTEPAAGGVAVANYVVTTIPSTGVHVCTDTTSPFECVLTGLEPGGTYTVVVTAVGGAGLGSSSDTSDSVALSSLHAPVLGAVTGGVGTITVNFTAPAEGLAIDSYAVTTTPTTGAHTCTDMTSPYSCELTGIPAGSYTVTVTAMSAGGDTSTVTSSSVTVTEAPNTVDPPVISGVTAGVGTATVTWTAPDGVTVDHYSVTATPDEGTGTDSKPTLCDDVAGNADELTCTISDLTAGTSYTFTVTLHTDAVGGLTSEATTDAVVVGPPGMPTAVTGLVLGPRSIIVGWTAPDNTAGIVAYRVQSTPGGLLCEQPNEAFRSCRYDNLVNGGRYTFKVMAIGDGDMGMSTSDASATFTLNPALPAAVPASAGTLTSSRGTRLSLGQTTTIGGKFYRPGTPLTIGIYPGPKVLMNSSVSSTGAFSIPVKIPTTVGTGTKTIVVAGLNNLGVMRYMTLRITVVRPSAAGGAVIPGGASTPEGGTGTSTGSGMTVGGSAALPTTGNSITTVILTGFGILLAGLAAIGVTYGAMAYRRRKGMRNLTPAS